MLKLRPYQEKGVNQLRASFTRGNKRVIFWLATGGGKTATFTDIANKLRLNKKKVLIVMRRRELIFQTGKSFEKFTGHKVSTIMGSEKGFDPGNPVQVCSIDTISRRIEKPEYEFLESFDFVIVDECHDTCGNFESDLSKKYISFLHRFRDCSWIGFTATPFNTGTKYLELWEDIVKPIEPHELRDQGFLVDERTYAPKKIDTSGLKIRAGDYDQKSLAQRASDSQIVGDIVDTWKKWGENRPSILFAVNKEHSKLMAEAFRQAGIPAIHQDESHNSKERENAIKQLTTGKIKILCNVNIFSTGVDIPQASCGIFARPTKSEILYVQQVGRVLRPYRRCARCKADCGAEKVCFRCGSSSFDSIKSDAIILDHANNCERFGLAFDQRFARLRPTRKRTAKEENELRTKTCESCFAVFPSNFSGCPRCHHVNEKQQRTGPESVEGELELKKAKQLSYSRMIKIKNDLIRFSNPNWKPAAKWLKLYEKHGEEIFEFKEELEMPRWVRSTVNNVLKREALRDIRTRLPKL